MDGWILYRYSQQEIGKDAKTHGLNRLLVSATQKAMNLTFYAPKQFEMLVTPGECATVILDESRVTLPDFIIPRLFENISYHGLALLRHFENLGIYVCNGADAIEAADDKMHTIQCLNHAHIPVPKTMLLKEPLSMKHIRSEIGFPLVIKVISGNQGVGVHLCESESALDELMGIFLHRIEQHPMLIQELISDSYGRDLRVIVIGGEAVACMKRTASGGFRANYARGGKVEAHPMTPEIKALAEASAKALNLEFAGIDLLFDKGAFKVCEINATPAFKGIELATKADIAGQLLDYISAVVAKRKSLLCP